MDHTHENWDNRYGDMLSHDRDRISMLDRALEGASAEHKARVRGLLLKYDIDEDNEFFMIFAALGQLTVLTEDAPESWQALFDDIYDKLTQWSELNLENLKSLEKHAETSHNLILTLKWLIDAQNAFGDRSSKMLSMLETLELEFRSFEKKSGLMRAQISNISDSLNRIENQRNTDSQYLNSMNQKIDQQTLISSANTGITVALAIGFLFLWNLTSRTQLQMAEQTKRIGWILEKLNREECLNGIKPFDDPQCLQD